jgi:hypothetical protein
VGRDAHENDPPISAEPVDEIEAALAERLGDERYLIELVRFGLDTEKFVNTNPIGKYLVSRGETELNEAVKKLLDLKDLQSEDARIAHGEARVALMVLRWLDEAITRGVESERLMSARDLTETPHG